jgi:uncharacterized protein YcbX
LKKCTSADDLKQWLRDQPPIMTRIFRPLALAVCGDARALDAAGDQVEQWLSDYVASESTLTPEQAAEALRGRLSGYVSDRIIEGKTSWNT